MNDRRQGRRSWDERNTIEQMFKQVRVIGNGRVGSALSARLQVQGLLVEREPPELVVLCVPDAAIPEVAAKVSRGPWVAHVSGATSLAALATHEKRFSVHPLQTFNRSGDPGQFDGAWAAVTAESESAKGAARWLAGFLNMRPFELDDQSRVLYHAGAVVASNYLVTLYRTARQLLERAGAPPEALVPLMRRTIDNGFDLTGPIARGDWAMVNAHAAAIRASSPELAELYLMMARATAS
jgi:predicted short-subunit dehydrogenase-like oxidoreductase (DUF2520 family)